MKRLAFLLTTALVASAAPALAQPYGPPSAAPAAAPPPPIRVRGTIQSVNGDVLTLQPATVNGAPATGAVKVTLDPAATVAITKKANFADITTASFVGATTLVQNGQDVATEVHIFPGGAPNLSSGPWDSKPQSTMTNAKVSDIGSASVAGVQNRTLTLTYPSGEKKVVVPPSAAIVTAAPGTRADLVKGEKVFIPRAAPTGDGYKAPGLQVGKDGVDPPQ